MESCCKNHKSEILLLAMEVSCQVFFGIDFARPAGACCSQGLSFCIATVKSYIWPL